MLSQTAPAKVNLYLHVLGRRDDGRHDLDSLIVFAEFGDRVGVSVAPNLSLEVHGPFAGSLDSEHDNLVMSAARALQAITDTSQGAAVKLDKQIPVAAGLGGGSADAAAVLRLLAHLWELDPAGDSVTEVAAGAGSDVAACLRGGPCYVVGAGDTVDPVADLPDAHAVLVNPGIALATGDVFAAFDQRAASGATRLILPIHGVEALARQLVARRNDLEPVAAAMVPEIGVALRALNGLPGCLLARMSGSGATCFGLFSRAGEAASGARVLQGAHGDWWVRDTVLRGSSALAPAQAAR